MVFDVPAEIGGALTILNEFYNEVKDHKDKNIEWIFVLSTPDLKETNNIKVIKFPWIKKGWGHRLYFDYVIAPILVKKYAPDKIFSLQNVVVPRTNVHQTVYLHQTLPFIDYKFSFKENKLFWIYQNIIGKSIISSIKRSNSVIVQTNWFKKECAKKSGVNIDKISVVPPKINLNVKQYFQVSKKTMSTFFYPSSALTYKNHKIVLEACKIIQEKNITDYEVIFTIDGDENKHILEIYNEVEEKKLPIKFIGNISREKVFDYYSESVLIFPSYIETFGLPLLEAKLHNGFILASDCSFSHEILDDYENVCFFDPFNPKDLSDLILRAKNEEFNYCNFYESEDSKLERKSTILSLLL